MVIVQGTFFLATSNFKIEVKTFRCWSKIDGLRATPIFIAEASATNLQVMTIAAGGLA